MRHTLKTLTTKTETVDGSHGREHSYTYKEVVCAKCGTVKKETQWPSDYKWELDYLKQLENEHNLDKLFELIEGIQTTINRSGIKNFIKLK